MKPLKRTVAILFVGAALTLAACQEKPKTEESDIDSTLIMPTDTMPMAQDDSVSIDSVMVADTTRR
jgi:hypothetical protein